LKLLVKHFSLELRKPSKKILTSRKKKPCKGNLTTVDAGIKDGISYVAMANLLILYLWDVESFYAIGANEAKIDRRGRLELEFNQLVPDIVRPLPLIARTNRCGSDGA